jgi:hypothetical protein
MLDTFRAISAPLDLKTKTDVPDHPSAIDNIGLLVNEPPGTAGLLAI